MYGKKWLWCLTLVCLCVTDWSIVVDGAAEDDHGHETTSTATAVNSCPGEEVYHQVLRQLAVARNVSETGGNLCQSFEEHGHNDSHGHEEEEHEEPLTVNSCEGVGEFVRAVILGLNLTNADCLEGHGHVDNNGTTSQTVTAAQAYGYGFLMVILVSLGSLLGILILPLIIKKSTKAKLFYEFAHAFMVALAASALLCDAILHLIPHVFNLHAHEEEGGAHAHEEEEENLEFLWKACVIVLGVYLFFIVELFLHKAPSYLKKCAKSRKGDDEENEMQERGSHKSDSNEEEKGQEDKEEEVKSPRVCDLSCNRIKPVAWLIIFGDALHNFTDGLALGAAISQSIPLGASTMLAILFHEIPHELGDYAVLVKSGLHWFTALLFNFGSSLTAVVGLFIGVAISTNSTTANSWILAITTGFFLYIALVDLFPELVHDEDAKLSNTGYKWWIRFLMINIGLLISFVILLLLAVYEERLNAIFVAK